MEESDIFGLTSVNATNEEVKLALNFLFNGTDSQSNNVYQEILSRDAHDPFVDAIQDELSSLSTALGLQEQFHFVQADAPGLSSQIVPGSAEGHGDTTNNLMFGQNGNDTINGGEGNDAIFGDYGDTALDSSLGSGNDSLSGDAGNDTIEGGAGNDTIEGGADNDRIDGGFGRDELSGGNGDDTFVLASGGYDASLDWWETVFWSDTIMDAETDDRAIFGGITLTGGELDGYYFQPDEFEGGTWVPIESDAGYVYYNEAENIYYWKESGDLFIGIFDGEDQYVDTVLVKNWSDGDLGIHLTLVDNRPNGGGGNGLLLFEDDGHLTKSQADKADSGIVLTVADILSGAGSRDNGLLQGREGNCPAASGLGDAHSLSRPDSVVTGESEQLALMAA